MNIILCTKGLNFIGDSNYLAFARVKYHNFIPGFPPLEGIQILLKDFGILFAFNNSVKKAIVSKKTD